MDYEIGYTDEGRVTTFNATYYAAGGFALEGTDMCLLSLVSSVDNAYNFDNFYAEVLFYLQNHSAAFLIKYDLSLISLSGYLLEN